MSNLNESVNRREFLKVGASCAAHIALLAQASPLAARTIWAPRLQSKVVVEEPWGRIEQLGDGIWALISTPLKDRKTLSNGAIIAGKNAVIVVEALASNDGAKWLSGWAEKLTGRPVDQVIVTHYHGDHTGGIGGFAGDATHKGAKLYASQATLQLVREDDTKRKRPAEPARSALLDAAVPINDPAPEVVDLGNRKLALLPRSGHTASDVVVEIDEPRVVIAGDLVWNRMFPNYVDAIPSALSRSVRSLERKEATAYVPGHGAMADRADLQRYLLVLDLVEAAARRAFERGVPAVEAAKEFKLHDGLGEWTMFSPRYYEVALGAWERELKAKSG